MNVDFSIGVFKIAVANSGTQIGLASQIAVPQETMMLFVGVRFDDRCFNLAANLDRMTKEYSILQCGVFDNSRAGSNENGSWQVANMNGLIQQNRAIGRIH